jgi:hypothetical protein
MHDLSSRLARLTVSAGIQAAKRERCAVQNCLVTHLARAAVRLRDLATKILQRPLRWSACGVIASVAAYSDTKRVSAERAICTEVNAA